MIGMVMWRWALMSAMGTLIAAACSSEDETSSGASVGSTTGTGSGTLNFFPGEGDGLFSAFVYKGRAFLFKQPSGVYFIDNSIDPDDVTKWFPKKLSAEYGVASEDAVLQALDDLMLKNTNGSVTSLAATQRFGDIISADVLRALKSVSFMEETTRRSGDSETRSIWYRERQQAFWSYQSSGGVRQDKLRDAAISLPPLDCTRSPRSTAFRSR